LATGGHSIDNNVIIACLENRFNAFIHIYLCLVTAKSRTSSNQPLVGRPRSCASGTSPPVWDLSLRQFHPANQ
jgi:hypothetical protein